MVREDSAARDLLRIIRAMPHPAWPLAPEVTFLNHGSFGSCPLAVLEEQDRLRRQLEAQPVRFFVRELEDRLDAVREALAGFVHARAAGFVFVPNATTGVNAVVRSLGFAPGDELIATDHTYNACGNVIDAIAARDGARVVVVPIPFPIADASEVEAAFLAAVTERTRFALLDHVTSPTGLVLPVERLVPALRARGITVMVDGAHAPGMLPVDLEALGADAYTANAHKWICAPKGAAFLHVSEALEEIVRPVVISHGANATRTDRSRYQVEFDWVGTDDPTAVLSIPTALATLESMHPDGWDGIRAANHALALAARDLICEAFDVPVPAPDDMLGSMAAVPLPDGPLEHLDSALATTALQDALYERHRVEVPIVPWPRSPKRLVRVSAQRYNDIDDYRKLVHALREELARERR